MNRREAVVTIGVLGAAGWLPASFARGSGKVRRVGAISTGSDVEGTPLLDAFVAAMGEHGYRSGQNLILDVRNARGDPTRYLSLAQELIALKPDALLGGNAGVALAMKGRTATIPIVMCTVSDAVGTGLAQSLSRPGGNVTGLSLQLHELGAKHIELMVELLPQMRTVALFTDATQPWALSESYERLAKTAAAAKKMAVNVHRVGGTDELRRIFRFLGVEKADALLLNPSPRFNALRAEIIQGASALRLPSFGWAEDLVQNGGLASYGPSFVEAYRRVAYFVDRIFKGAKPADLPIEQPTKFSLAINKRTAGAIGLKVPQSILLRADLAID